MLSVSTGANCTHDTSSTLINSKFSPPPNISFFLHCNKHNKTLKEKNRKLFPHQCWSIQTVTTSPTKHVGSYVHGDLQVLMYILPPSQPHLYLSRVFRRLWSSSSTDQILLKVRMVVGWRKNKEDNKEEDENEDWIIERSRTCVVITVLLIPSIHTGATVSNHGVSVRIYHLCFRKSWVCQ